MNKETLKIVYKRHNESEQQVYCATIDELDNVTVFNKYNTETIVRNRISQTNGTCLFLDAENPNLTLKGKNKKTEFRLSVNKKDIWVEVKSQKVDSNIMDAVLGEIARAKRINGEYWLVLLGECYGRPIYLKQIYEMVTKYGLNTKIRIFNSIDKYQIELRKIK